MIYLLRVEYFPQKFNKYY